MRERRRFVVLVTVAVLATGSTSAALIARAKSTEAGFFGGAIRGPVSGTTIAPPLAAGRRPTQPPVRVCGRAAVLNGPASAPAGAVVVPAGDNAALTEGMLSRDGTTYWFAPGVHTLGGDAYSQIVPGNNSTFLGAPGAVIDGQHKNLYAFTQGARNVTIKFLTIRNFGTGASNNDEGVVNHDRGDGWVVSNSTIVGNDGAGIMLGPNSKTTYNCLKSNGQYGFSSFAPQGTAANVNVLLDRNEVVGNNTDDWEKRRPGCGCTGGGKFWETSGAVVTNNYVHDNRGAGLWADTNNRGVRIQGNWIENNDAEGIFYEASFNFSIRENVLIRNAVVRGRVNAASGDPFPVGAIYVSEAGGDPRAGAQFAQSEIVGNYFKDNWDGVVLWENADRYCRPADEQNGDVTATCPFFDRTQGVRIKTQNVTVTNNDFVFAKAAVNCTTTRCGRNAVMSNYGTVPANSPYRGDVVQKAITFDQRNVWSGNRYQGPWHFMPYDMATDKTFAQWRAAPYQQDLGSTLR